MPNAYQHELLPCRKCGGQRSRTKKGHIYCRKCNRERQKLYDTHGEKANQAAILAELEKNPRKNLKKLRKWKARIWMRSYRKFVHDYLKLFYEDERGVGIKDIEAARLLRKRAQELIKEPLPKEVLH